MKITRNTRPVKRMVIQMVMYHLNSEGEPISTLNGVLIAELFNALNRKSSYRRKQERLDDAK